MPGIAKRFLPLLFARIVLPVCALAVVSVAALPQRANAQAAFATSKNLCIGVPDPINNNPNTCPFAPIVGVNQQVFYVIKVTNPPGSPQQNITLTEQYPGPFGSAAIVCTDQTPNAPPLFLSVANPVINFQLQMDTTVTCTIAGTFNNTAVGLQNNIVDVDNKQSPVQQPSVQTNVATTTQLATDLAVTKSVSPTSINVTAGPQTVTYTVTIKNNGPNAVDVGHWFVLHDTLALLPSGVPLYATLQTAPGSFSCTSTAGTDCLDPAGPTPTPPGQQLIGTMAPHPMFDWSFPAPLTPGYMGHIAGGGTITLTWNVKIEKLPNLSCVISLTSNGLKNQAFFTLTNPDGTAANDTNNANNTASAPLSVTLAGTVDPNCGAGQLTMTKTQVSPANPVTWGGPTWPPTPGTVTYDITIKNTSMPAQTITIPGTKLQDFVVEGIGTPPFTRTFVSAVCINPSSAAICTAFNTGGGNPPPPAPFPLPLTQTPYTFYGQQQLGWSTNPPTAMVLAPGDFFTIRIAFNYFGPDCETVPNVTPKLIDNKAQITYKATVVGAASGSQQNVQYTQVAIAHTQMKPQQQCKFVVTKSYHPGSPTTAQFGGPPLVYDVTFTNNDASRTIGTVMDSVRITELAYATQVPFKSSWVCTQTGGVTPLPAPPPPVNGTAIYTGSPTQGSPVFQFTNLHFNNGAQLKCTVTIKVDRPLPNNPNCSMDLAYFENAALLDVTHPYNTNVPWPPSSAYTGALSNPTLQNTNWATLKAPLPKCYNFNVYKTASVNGITTNAWTSPNGPAVNYTIQVTNTGTSGTLTGSGTLFNWNGLLVGDVISPPYASNPIKLTTPSSCLGPWCTPLVPSGNSTASAATSLAGVANLAAGAFGIWGLTLQPTPNFTAGTYIDNCASVAPAGTFTGPDYYSKYDLANPPPKTCVQVPVLATTTLGVTKIIVNATGHAITIPQTLIGVQVACQTYPLLSSGNLTLTVGGATGLANGGRLNATGSIQNVPVAPGETCTVTEPTRPAVPPGVCGREGTGYWDTVIAPTPISITAGPNSVTVTNTLKCFGYFAIYKVYDDQTGGTPVPSAYASGFPIQLSCSNFTGTVPVAIKAGFFSSNDPVLTTTDPSHSMTVGPSTSPTVPGTTCLVTEALLPLILNVRACNGGSASWDTTYLPAASSGAGGTATIVAAQTAKVTVTNTLRCDPPVCSITITKQTTPAGGTGFNFSSAWSGLQGITLNGGQSTTKQVPCGPIFNVFETPKPGWTLGNIACTVTGGTGNFKIIGANANPAFQPGDNEVNFDSLTPGANLHCTFTNSQPSCDLEIKKTVSPNPLVSGQPATVTMTVTNVGNAACPPGSFPGTTVQDPKPAGLTFTAPPTANQPVWQCSLGVPTGDASCAATGLTMPPGDSATFTIKGNVTAGPGSEVTNCARVSNQNDTNPANDSSCVTLQVK